MATGPDTLLFTGFPGFIGARLLPRLLELRPETRVACLVQERFAALAVRQIAEIEQAHAHARGRLQIVLGDIALPGLGIEPGAAQALKQDLVGAYHLAAVYDLAVKRDLGERINVAGTRHVLETLADAKRFTKLDYVSTAYVSGTHPGRYCERDLDVGQAFKNHYEETKFLAEVELRKSGLPATVYRPAVVVGDSRTGETAKFDGPYFVLSAMEKLPSPGLFLRIGSGRNPANLVPIDFVIEALARLSASPGSLGKTYHLTDPEPLSVLEIARLFARLLEKRFAFVPVPLRLARALVGNPIAHAWLGMPKESLDYFDNPCRYDAAEAARDLDPHGVRCPRFADYAPALVAFHKKMGGTVRRQAMI
jgi:thioester reductase-like protein